MYIYVTQHYVITLCYLNGINALMKNKKKNKNIGY